MEVDGAGLRWVYGLVIPVINTFEASSMPNFRWLKNNLIKLRVTRVTFF